MEQIDLLMLCISSFAAVFCVLIFLAVVMRLLILCFPYREEETDPALFAAIHSAYATIYPGAKITKIEEVERR
ncbi:MAG: hypothetical protein K9J79_02370 [Desulfobacteraceae bacterium]|nr:hypothetical protein [Desulfobacteraceae bacterium]MCF8094186.1 hypothetical protein [Desulfobacteraceae bacterium]